jgi:hypothetical protein
MADDDGTILAGVGLVGVGIVGAIAWLVTGSSSTISPDSGPELSAPDHGDDVVDEGPTVDEPVVREGDEIEEDPDLDFGVSEPTDTTDDTSGNTDGRDWGADYPASGSYGDDPFGNETSSTVSFGDDLDHLSGF